MKSLKILFLKSFLLLFFSLMVCSAITQPVSPPLDPNPPGSLVHPPNASPIDGGLVILLSFGCIYAGKELHKMNKKR